MISNWKVFGEDLSKVVENLDLQSVIGVGHSMGGHGALVCALRNPGKYVSASAFSPICAPVKCPWGEKCFTGYLGTDKKQWEQYDASLLAGTVLTTY